MFQRRRWTKKEIIHKASNIVAEVEGVEYHRRIQGSKQSWNETWKAPKRGSHKVNSDAAKFPKESTGLGGVTRDNSGDVVVAMSEPVRGKFEAKAMALRHALSVTLRLGLGCLKLKRII